MKIAASKVAIVDYGLGNLFSVATACRHVGLDAQITASGEDILSADAVLLPGVGAYGDAMATLRRLDLVGVLRDVAASGKPLVGICLGVQLLMSESFEFGRHEGLGIIEGSVVRLENPMEGQKRLKVPQVGWNRVCKFIPPGSEAAADPWKGTLLEEVSDGEYMYFVHSFVVQPVDPNVVLSVSEYGHIAFCSSLRYKNIFACQFHPERSGPNGLKIYRTLATFIQRNDQ